VTFLFFIRPQFGQELELTTSTIPKKRGGSIAPAGNAARLTIAQVDDKGNRKGVAKSCFASYAKAHENFVPFTRQPR
jgi:hypothetical protein